MTADRIDDLRSALDLLRMHPGHLVETAAPVDPYLELAAVYRAVGAGTPVRPPARVGPAMLFRRVRGYDDARIAVGVLASRERTALLLGTAVDRLPWVLGEAVAKVAPAVERAGGTVPCQEVVHTEGIDLMRMLPVPTHTPKDGGPYFCMGLLRAEDPETGQSDITIHRLCVHGPDRLSVYFVPGRHIDQFRLKAERAGRALPVTVHVGLDPAIYLASCFEPPTTPLGFDELGIAGALRGRPVDLVRCVSVDGKAIAKAEIVIEGELVPGERVREDAPTGTGYAMPEFPGYLGRAQAAVPVMRVRVVTHRRQPIFQTLVGPGVEHTCLTGIPTEASIIRLVEDAMPGRLMNVYAHPAGGGKYLAILQFRKLSAADEGRQRQAALAAFAAFGELKHVILVDDDVNIYDTDDVMWAMTTRYQGDRSTMFLPGVRCHPLDPSQSPEFSPSIPAEGMSCKTVFDCTVPWHLRERFVRAPFGDADARRFLPPEERPAGPCI
jgi:4-hydroxy-3-polyprenylbenzoate decarboxylase